MGTAFVAMEHRGIFKKRKEKGLDTNYPTLGYLYRDIAIDRMCGQKRVRPYSIRTTGCSYSLEAGMHAHLLHV